MDENRDRRREHVRRYDASERGQSRREQWEIDNAESLKENRRAQYEKNKDRELALMSEWVKNNRDRSKAIKKKYAQTEAGRRVSLKSAHTRIARKKNAPGHGFTWDEFHAVCKEFDFTCLSCLKVLPFDDLEADHVVAISKGGHHDIWNIQPLCRSCNPSKGAKTIDYRPAYRERHGKRDWLLGAPNLGAAS